MKSPVIYLPIFHILKQKIIPIPSIKKELAHINLSKEGNDFLPEPNLAGIIKGKKKKCDGCGNCKCGEDKKD